jgi:potassium-transporting ATPase potassium-binding subunit
VGRALSSLLQSALFLAAVLALVRPAGAYLSRVFTRERTWLDPVLGPVERGIYRVARIDAAQDMSWAEYAASFVVFGLVGTLLLYGLLRVQRWLPWFDAAHLTTRMTPDLAANTAISFGTTSTWQAYGGETTMSYATQMLGLAGQNFLAGAAGLAIGIAFIRGLASEGTGRLGNFWVDVVRAILWVLLPLSLIGALVLVWQGVPMNFDPYTHATTVEGLSQTVAQGPVAALEWIKNLGTNGGGFFNANGAHPYENPTPLANVLELLAIVVLPAGLTATFGRLTRRPRDGWTLLAAMVVMFVVGLAGIAGAEHRGNPRWGSGVVGGNMEGKEVRFGVDGSALTAAVTSNGATGSTNAMHDSFLPLGGMVPLLNMLLGEIVFGGLGTGLYSIVMAALLGVFIIGLMVGRTPQYLGKQLGPGEVRVIVLYSLIGPASILLLTAVAVVVPAGAAGLTTNTGPHGFTEILYAYTSAFANNGQAFAGLSANSPFYNITTAAAMMLGRYGLAVPALALAGRFSRVRPRVEVGAMPTHGALFACVIIGAAVLLVALTFLPALALGPVLEHVSL